MMACPGCGAVHAQPHADMSLAELPHLGADSVTWLKTAGITLVADLVELGAVGAYRRVEALGHEPSLNLLYALEAAISGEHWLEVKRLHKDSLLTALADAREQAASEKATEATL